MNIERRNKLLVISLVTLFVMTTTVLLISGDSGPSVDRQLFTIENVNEIDKVTLHSKKQKIELESNGYRWRVNSTYDADPDMIKVLFATLLQQQPQREVGSSDRDSISKVIEHEGVLVTLFVDGAPVKSFYAGGNPAKTKTYFRDTETGDVYQMNIPGYRVYVAGVYELNESGFRKKLVFDFEWRNFKTLVATFPDKPSESFKVSLQKDQVGIEGVTKVDTARLNTFLDQVSLLTVDEYVSDLANKTPEPMMKIEIADVAGRTYELTLFSPDDSGKIPAMIRKQPAIFDPQKIKAILKPKSFFVKK